MLWNFFKSPVTSSLYSALSLISDERWGERFGGTEILRLLGTLGDEAETWVGEERGDRAGGGGGGGGGEMG